MKSLLILSLSFFAMQARAENAAELTCKAQAKEIAVQTYSNCITEARNNQIEQIRKNYKDELASLKTKYDRELKKMGAMKAAAASKPSPAKSKRGATPTVQEVSEALDTPKPAKGVARQLPTRKATRELPVKSVTGSDNETTTVIERESGDAENLEVIPMPEVGAEEAPAT